MLWKRLITEKHLLISFCHSDRSEEPLFEVLLDDKQRFFAAVRMTRVGVEHRTRLNVSSDMPKPSFFIAGNPKGGTSALYQFLKTHPGVFMCRPKEPKYFAKDFFREAGSHRTFRRITEADYLALFDEAEPDQLCGEASVWYLYSRVAAQEIQAFNPSAKLIFVLREPVDFLYSYYLHLRRGRDAEAENVKDFRKALALEPERKRGRKIPRGCLLPEFLYYSERVKYAEHLERFFACFDPAQIKIIIYDDFKRDNESVYRDVLAFLGLSQDFTPKFETHNKRAMLRSRPLHRLVRTVTFGKGWAAPLKPVVKRLIPEHRRRTVMRLIWKRLLFKPKEKLDPALVRELKQQFHGEVETLSTLLGRDLLSLWGYSRPGETSNRDSPIPALGKSTLLSANQEL